MRQRATNLPRKLAHANITRRRENLNKTNKTGNPAEHGDGYSIIIPAFNSAMFLQECLDSITHQSHFGNNNNYEILLGIDACPSTLKKVQEIKHKYEKLKVFYFENNHGPYIVKNSLIPIAKYNLLLFFDSDDHMEKNMVSTIDEKMKQGYDICKIRYYNYKSGTSPRGGIIKPKVADGVGCHKREVHDIIGGYEEWRCGADSDFCFRCKKKFRIYETDAPLFYRRVHPNSLTQKNETNPKSTTRREIAKKIRDREAKGYYKKPRKVKIKQREFREIIE